MMSDDKDLLKNELSLDIIEKISGGDGEVCNEVPPEPVPVNQAGKGIDPTFIDKLTDNILGRIPL